MKKSDEQWNIFWKHASRYYVLALLTFLPIVLIQTYLNMSGVSAILFDLCFYSYIWIVTKPKPVPLPEIKDTNEPQGNDPTARS